MLGNTPAGSQYRQEKSGAMDHLAPSFNERELARYTACLLHKKLTGGL